CVAHSVSLVFTIDVAALAVAVDFYERALGLHVSRRLGPDIAELGGAETPVYLTQHAAGTAPFAGAAAPRDYRRHWTPVHPASVGPPLGPSRGAPARAPARGGAPPRPAPAATGRSASSRGAASRCWPIRSATA